MKIPISCRIYSSKGNCWIILWECFAAFKKNGIRIGKV